MKGCCRESGAPREPGGQTMRLVGLGEIDAPEVRLFRPGGVGSDVEVEDLGRHVQRRGGVGNVDDAADAPLDWGGAEDRVRLLAGEAELLQVFDRVEAR